MENNQIFTFSFEESLREGKKGVACPSITWSEDVTTGMKKDDDVKLSTERILFLFCILFLFFFVCGGNFSRWSIHSTPSTCRNFSFSFFPLGLCPALCPNWVLCRNTYKPRFDTTSNNIPVFLFFFFNVFSLSLFFLFIIFYFFFYLRSVLISGNLRIDRSSIDHDHRDNSGVVVGFSFVVQLKRIMRTKDTFTQTRIKELRRKLLTDNIFFDWFFSVYYPPFFSLAFVVVSFYNCSCLSLFSFLLLWLWWGYLILIHWEFLDRLIIHARSQNTFYLRRRRLSLAVESSPTAGRFNLLHCCCPAEELTWMANNQIYLTIYTLRSTTAALSLKLLQLVRIIAWR